MKNRLHSNRRSYALAVILILIVMLGVGGSRARAAQTITGTTINATTLNATTLTGTLTGTNNAANVSAGTFGANTGSGNYSFPGTLTVPNILYANREGGNISLGSTGYTGGLWTSAAYMYLANWNDATKGITINLNTGNVGIGTTSPVGLLHVVTPTTGVMMQVTDTSGYGVYAASENTLNFNYGQNANTAGWINYAGYQNGYTQFRDLNIANGKGTAIATFQGSTGNVGIGTTGPGYKLDVSGTLNATDATLSTATFSSSAPLNFTNGGNTGTYNRTEIYANQNNTSGSNSNGIFVERGRLTDSGSAEIRYFTIGARGGQAQWSVDGSGNVVQTGSLTASTISGSYSGTMSAANLSAGTFGGNTGGGSYTFPSNIIVNQSYGYGLVGQYDPGYYRLVYSMGSSYMLASNGTTLGNLYGLFYAYDSTAGGYKNVTGYSLGHGVGLANNGTAYGYWGPGGFWTSGAVYTGSSVSVAGADTSYGLTVNGSIGTYNGQYIYARYNASENYKGTFSWYGLQLGNNGDNYIVAGRTNPNGQLKFVVNNTSDFNTINGITAMTIAASGNVGIGTTGPVAGLDLQSSVGTFRQKALTQVVTDELDPGVSAKRWEIARASIDYNDWNYAGPIEVELYESYYSYGLKKKYVVWYGIGPSYGVYLSEVSGNGTNNFQVTLGSETVVSGDIRYIPIYVDSRSYTRVVAVVKTNRSLTTTNPPNYSGAIWVNSSPTGSLISDFTADSVATVNKGVNSYFDSNVGIGTTSPGAKLDVAGLVRNSAPSQGTVELSGLLPGYADNTYPTLKTSGSYLYFSTGGTYTAQLSNSNGFEVYNNSYGSMVRLSRDTGNSWVNGYGGNFGIGTTGPTARLHVIGNDNQIAVDTASEGAAGIFLRQAGTNKWELYDYGTAFHLYNYGTASDAITVLRSNGYVGIGQTSPYYKLTVNGSLQAGYVVLGDANNNVNNTIEFASPNTGTYTAGHINYYGGGNLSLVNGGGSVTIGTTASPAGRLHISSTGNTWVAIDTNYGTDDASGLRIRNNGTDKWFVYNSHTSVGSDKLVFGSASVNAMTIDQSGYVGIGTTAPGYKLDVNGNLNASGGVYDSGNRVYSAANTGIAVYNCNVAPNACSGNCTGLSNSSTCTYGAVQYYGKVDFCSPASSNTATCTYVGRLVP